MVWTRKDIEAVKLSLIWCGSTLTVIAVFIVSIAIDVAGIK